MRRPLNNILVLAVAAISVVYLINPGAGVIELLPDNLPIVGNLDEAGAVALLIASLRYYGVDVTRLFERDEGKQKNDDTTT